jgi:antitoxin YefM
MTIEVSYSEARRRLASLLDDVTQNREMVIIKRRNGESAALISADELAGLAEAVHLLRSPANAARLMQALARALKDQGERMSTEELMAEVGLDE